MESIQFQPAIAQHKNKEGTSEISTTQFETSKKATQNDSVEQRIQQPVSSLTAAYASSSTTMPPSPPPAASTRSSDITALSALHTDSTLHPVDGSGLSPHPLSAGLRLQTDIPLGYSVTPATDSEVSSALGSGDSSHRPPNPMSLPPRSPNVKKTLASSVGTGSAPNSAMSSPMLNGMPDVTPLPSPLLSGDSPGPWKKLSSRPASREYIKPGIADSALVTANGESLSSAIANQSRRRAYHGLISNASDTTSSETRANREMKVDGHGRNRSISEYVPESMQVPKPRNQTVSGSHAGLSDAALYSTSPTETNMRRERNLAVERGMAPAHRQPNILPTPPASRTGAESSDSDSSVSNTTGSLHRTKKPRFEYYDAHTRNDQKRRRWRALKTLGQGTFSRVILATSQVREEDDRIDEDDVYGERMDGITSPIEPIIDQRKLVAIKICEHGPKGGASEERVEMSLKRELEIMKSIHHPSLVHLKAWNIEETRAILVLSYCPGGDLFEVASEHHDLLVPSLLRRMFAELVGAVQYLHNRHIVHRDIKLENVLVNLPQSELAKPIDWATFPYSVLTLTDLGLSRRVADDEKLTTRCGSDDYAAPEVIMGQPYDGRAVDAWSLGVLLYALLESRLPFDPTPRVSEGHKQRSKTSHRIARVEWRWVQFSGDDGDHEGDSTKFEQVGLRGAMDVTEGLLKRARSRWTIEKIAEEPWVKDAINVDGGIKFRDEDNPEEVSEPSMLQK